MSLKAIFSEQAFSQARATLSRVAFPLLNDWLIERAQRYGFIPLWHGLRLVAADASTVRFGLRASQVKGWGKFKQKWEKEARAIAALIPQYAYPGA